MTHDVRLDRGREVNEPVALLIAIVSGACALTAGARPTGSVGVDAVLVFVSVSLVTWASAAAPWWASTAALGIAASIAGDPLVTAVGVCGFVGALVLGARRADSSESGAAVGAVAANVLIRSDLEGFLGLSAIVGVAVGLALVVLGIFGRSRQVRRVAWYVAGGVGVLVLGAVVGLGAAGVAARPHVTAGADAARAGIDLLNDGEYQLAADEFERASREFVEADGDLSGMLAAPARILPGIAQNVRAGSELAGAAGEALTDAAAALRDVDPSALRFVGGAIDVDAVRSVSDPLARVQQALESLQATTDDVRSPWLIGRFTQELDELDADIAEQEPRLQNAIDAVELAPAILGDGAPRRYLILFTSPAEARGLGGFVGNYAELTIDGGRIRVDEFGRRSALEDVVLDQGARCRTCPPEFLDRYGRYGFSSGSDGGVASRAWSNITMPAHFPHVAETALDLYPQSGGSVIDGVIVMDPYVVAALMEYTGPVELAEFGVTVQPDEAAQFILEDQYVIAGDEANADRIDALETLGETAIQQILTGALPEPPELARDLAPLISERRLLFWTADVDEQELFDRIGLLGTIPPLDPIDGGFSVSVTNAGASKIDVFLERDVAVSVVDGAAGRQLVADVTFSNTAPSTGLPRFVIGNEVGLPDGYSRLLVSFYGPSTLTRVTRDGVELAVEPMPEGGWMAYGTMLELAPGASAGYRLEFSLPDATARDDDTSDPVVFEQPLSRRD